MHDLRSGSLRHHSNARDQFRRRDRDLSHLQGRSGYNTGMDFHTHFERDFGSRRRKAMSKAGREADRIA
jgi:hypothetical protein